MVCVVYNEIMTEGDFETPEVREFASKKDAVNWAKKDVIDAREYLAGDGYTPSVDEGDLDETDPRPWWHLGIGHSGSKNSYGGCTRMFIWDIVPVMPSEEI